MAKTLRAVSKKRSTRRVKMSGGACNVLAEFMKRIPNSDEYERMVNEECSAINTSKTYEEFEIQQNAACVVMIDKDCERLKAILSLVSEGRLRNMDMEYCASMASSIVFFDRKGSIVIANDR